MIKKPRIKGSSVLHGPAASNRQPYTGVLPVAKGLAWYTSCSCWEDNE